MKFDGGSSDFAIVMILFVLLGGCALMALAGGLGVTP